MATIGDRIRLLRESANLTQEEFGKLFGLVKSTISLYEHGKSTPNDQIKTEICKYFDVSMDYLLGLPDVDNGSDTKNNIVGERIKFLRERNQMTQKDLASQLNISNTTLSQYENGHRIPSDEVKLKIARLFQVTTDYLLDENVPLMFSPTLPLSEIKLDWSSIYENAKTAPLAVGQGDRIVQKALAGTGLLAEDGSLPPESEELISDFLSRNADILEKLLKDKRG